MARLQLVDLDFASASRPTNLPNAVSPGDAVPLSQVKALVDNNAWKDSVRAATTANITLTGPGAAIDGVALANGERVLVKDQTTQTQNGIYIFNGSAAAMTRSTDADVFDELESAVVRVEEGTANSGTKWAQTQVNGVVGTNNIIWISDTSAAPTASTTQAGVAQIGTQTEVDTGTANDRIVTPLTLKSNKIFNKSLSGTLGDGSATSFNLDHNLNNRDVVVSVYRNSGSFDEVIADVTRPTVNRVTVTFSVAPAASAYRVVVQGTQV